MGIEVYYKNIEYRAFNGQERIVGIEGSTGVEWYITKTFGGWTAKRLGGGASVTRKTLAEISCFLIME